MKKLILLLVVTLVAFAGCKKDKVNQDAIDNKIITAYIQANNLTAKSTNSGLYYVVTNPGDATRPVVTVTGSSVVYVFYRGYILNGTQIGSQFDSSYESGEQPAQFTLSTLIPGFQEGLKLFGKGGEGQLIIPSTLAYKDATMTGIPANSVLVFNFKLVTFQ